MKIENGKIVSATEAELFKMYLSGGYDDCMDFYEYKWRMKDTGCEVEE